MGGGNFSKCCGAAEQRQLAFVSSTGAVETNFINTAREAIEFVQRCPRPTPNHSRVKSDVLRSKSIRRSSVNRGPHFAHFHANRQKPEGTGFWRGLISKPIAAALKEVGYGDFVSGPRGVFQF